MFGETSGGIVVTCIIDRACVRSTRSMVKVTIINGHIRVKYPVDLLHGVVRNVAVSVIN